MTDITRALSEELSSWNELSLLFLYEVRTEFVISTWVAIVDITDFGSTLSTFFLASINSDKNSKIEISLETDHGYNIFTMSAGGWAYSW